MKIAVLSPFYPYRGGVAQVSARLLTELSEKHEVKAFSFTLLYPKMLFPGTSQFVDADDDRVLKISNERILNSVNPFSYIKTARAINSFSPDVLIIPYWMSFLAPAYGIISRFLKSDIKVVSLVHNAIPHEPKIIDKPFSRYFFNSCDGFITLSAKVKEDLIDLGQLKPILVQEHPIFDHYAPKIARAAACEQLNIDADKKNLLFFGFIRDYKGLDLLIDAMNDLDDSYQLIIAGECYGDFNKYQTKIDNLKNKESIILFNRYISDDMVSLLFSASDVLVLPYRSATQSGVVASAYQLETPIIATNVGALGSYIRDAGTGLLVDEVSAEAIAKGIQSFFSSDYTALYQENLKKEKARLSWATLSQSVEQFVSNL